MQLFWVESPYITCVQYREGYHDACGGYLLSTVGDVQYRGDIMIIVGDILRTVGSVQYRGGYHEYRGGLS